MAGCRYARSPASRLFLGVLVHMSDASSVRSPLCKRRARCSARECVSSEELMAAEARAGGSVAGREQTTSFNRPMQQTALFAFPTNEASRSRSNRPAAGQSPRHSVQELEGGS